MEPIRLGPVTLYPFGLLLVPLVLGALALIAYEMKKAGLKNGTASWFSVLAIPLCFVCAHLGYCIFIVDQMIGSEDFGMLIRVGEGGFLL